MKLDKLLDWPGFDWGLAGEAWRRPPSVQMEVGFAEDEIQATADYFERTYIARQPDAVRPAQKPSVRLRVAPETGDQVRADTHAEFYQFHGRDYARIILRESPEGFSLFRRVGTVFWYTEHRSTSSLTPVEENGHELRFDMTLLRRRLSDLKVFHDRVAQGNWQMRPGQRDLFADLERAYETVFPGHRFDGPAPRTEIDQVLAEPWFYLFDSHRLYELSEMSGGERAIFPIIFDFTNLNIHNSVVLIDELELHLHPPLQQGLLRALSGLGKDNQFIVTTHSDAVAAVVPDGSLYRIETE